MKRFLAFFFIIINLPALAQEERISLLFVGDIMQHGQQLTSAKTTSGYDYTPNYRFARFIIKNADLAIANLELTLPGSNYAGYPTFGAPDALAEALKDAGFDYLVTANNHSLDRRKHGLERTIEVLDRMQIPHTGTFIDAAHREQTYPSIIEKKGFRIAILNYTYGTNGIPVTAPNIVNLLDPEQMKRDIASAKAKSPDIIVVFTHWGQEYQSLPNEQQKTLTRMLFDEGVDLVIGSHPHVLQPVEWHKNDSGEDQLVAYSLGNYISNQRKRYQDGGMALEVTFVKDSSGVRIEDAGYYLSWVYPSPSENNQFYILPAPFFESDPLVIKEESNRKKMQQFFNDSRILFEKYNVGVKEYRAYRLPETVEDRQSTEDSEKEPTGVWGIQLLVVSGAWDRAGLPDHWKSRLVEVKSGSLYKYRLVGFASREAAEEALRQLQQETGGFADAFLVTEKN